MKTHRSGCPALQAWDVPGACTCGGITPARFYAELPAAPVGADLAGARAYHMAIMELLDRDDQTERGDPGKFTRAERGNLQRLERRWRARVTGTDRRWVMFGAKPGRLPADIEGSLRPAPSDTWERKLLRGETR